MKCDPNRNIICDGLSKTMTRVGEQNIGKKHKIGKMLSAMSILQITFILVI